MATTFSLDSVSYGDYDRRLVLTCSQTKNVQANTSTINWTLTVRGGSNNYYQTGPTTVKINGETVYYKDVVYYYEQEFPAGPTNASTSGTLTVNHGTDGTKSVSVSITTAIYYSSTSTTSGTWTLDSIDRNAPSLTLSTSDITAYGFKVNATTNVDCDNWEYRIGTSGNFQSFSTTVGKSATYTLSGSPATAYTVYIRAQRQLNHVTTTSSISATTLGYATIDSIANINTGSSAVVKFTPKATTFWYKVDFKLNGSTLVTETIGNVAQTSQYSYTTSYKFPVTLLPNSTSATITATLYTYTTNRYNTLVGTGQTKTFTLTVPSSVVPSISNSFSVTPYSTNAWLSNKSFYVSGYTQIKIVAPVSAGTGAQVSSVTVTGQSIYSSSSSSNTYTFYTQVLTGSGSKSFTTTVTDSRGRTASRTDSVTYLAYSAPAVNAMTAQRGTYSGGTWTSDENGNHIRITASATGSLSSQGNTLTLTLTAKIGGIDTSPTAQSGNYYYWTGTTADQSYVVTAEVVDLVGNTSTSSITVSSVSVPMNINTVIPSIAFGKVAETSNAVEVADNWRLKTFGKYNTENYSPYAVMVVGQSQTAGYAKIATVTVTGNDSYEPIQFEVSRLTDFAPITIYLRFAGGNTTPSFSLFYKGLANVLNGYPFSAFAVRSGSAYEVYVQKVTQSDRISVRTHIPYWMQERCNVTYDEKIQTSVPSGAQMAIPLDTYGVYYGTCTTSASTPAKVATVNALPQPLPEGTTVVIQFTHTNTASPSELTLNVQTTGYSVGAKTIVMLREAGRQYLVDAGALFAGAPCMFTYCGGYWWLMDYDKNTTYSAMTQSEANTGTATTGRLITASVLDAKIKNVNKDFVVEHGTSGNWTYRKWNSGDSECWGTHSMSVTGWSAWGVLYETNGAQFTYPSGLFVAEPNYNATPRGSGGLMMEATGAGSKTQTPKLYAVRPNAGGTDAIYWYIHARGKWK